MSFESKHAVVVQYLRKISGQEKESNLVDHNYPKAWNSYPDSQRIKPARMLFMKDIPRNSRFPDNKCYEEIDVVSCKEPTQTPFDNQKTKLLATEWEDVLKSHTFFADKENKNSIDPDFLPPKQSQLYSDVLEVLQSLTLSRLVHANSSNEFVKRKLMIEQAAAQIRKIFATFFWDEDLVTWLHKTLMNDSDLSLIVSYLHVLQSLMPKTPALVEKLVQSHSCTKAIVLEILKRHWDPALPILNQHKPKKLPRNPAFIICPSGPTVPSSCAPRLQFWLNYFNSLGKIVNVSMFPPNDGYPLTIEECLDLIISAVRSKVSELKNHYPEKPLILVGWTIGALIACHVALLEPVDSIICLGFPLTGVNGSRGDLTDPLLDNHAPTLFVVGQNANMCSTDNIEDFRSRMQAESGLVVVGGADDFLRMNSMKMLFENVTQTMVDHCIMDEVTDFLLSVFAKLPQTSSASQITQNICSPIKEETTTKSSEVQAGEKRKRRKPREYSPEIFPARKKPKPSPPVSRRRTTSATNMKSLETESDSTSSDPGISTKNVRATKTAKRKHGKSRSRSNALRKKLPTKSKSSNKTEKQTPKIMKAEIDFDESLVSSKTIDSKSTVPFSKHIFPKKNDPVDVEKAFGNDSKFLPRPLTPQEPEDTVSADETEKVLAEMEAKADLGVAETSTVNTLNNAVENTPEKVSAASSQQSTAPLVFSISSNAGSVLAEEAKTVSIVSSFDNVLQEDKSVSPGVLQNFKGTSSISVAESNLKTYKSPTKSTIITIPSVSAAKLLASSPNIKAQPGKMIQLLSKANIPVNIIGQDVLSASTSANPGEVSHSIAHTFIADITGEPAKENPKMVVPTFSSSLARLATVGDTQTQFRSKIFPKQTKTQTSHVRIETPEEIAEKNLAVQALNSSFGSDFPSTSSSEPGYSICYAKPDGSVVSHTVTGPGYVHYLSKKPTGSPNIKSQRGVFSQNQTTSRKIFHYKK